MQHLDELKGSADALLLRAPRRASGRDSPASTARKICSTL